MSAAQGVKLSANFLVARTETTMPRLALAAVCGLVLAHVSGVGAFASHVRAGHVRGAATQHAVGGRRRTLSVGAPPRSITRRAPPEIGRARIVLQLRGGQGLLGSLRSGSLSVFSLYNSSFWALALACLFMQLLARARNAGAAGRLGFSREDRSLRNRFLAVFWVYKMADWLQGPYFYDVYASKVIGGARVTADGVARLFLAGFGSTMLVGPFVGSMVDSLGRKKASLAFALAYSLGALSTATSSLPLLYAGRFFGGVGTSLLFSAPEAWLVGEASRNGTAGDLLSHTFGLAYLGDSIVAMLAGQLAGGAAATGGPVAPFFLSTAFLGLGAALVALLWRENYGTARPKAAADADAGSGGSSASVLPAEGESGAEGDNRGVGDLVARVGAAWRAVLADRRILLVGAVQAFFEGAMYTFVLVWPPAMRAAIAALSPSAGSQPVPFGSIFSCFMACCMLGSSAFALASRAACAVEDVTVAMLAAGVGSMAIATASASRSALLSLTVALFAFEACVGVYFPCIGTLRSKLLPDEHRGAIMNLFGIPLNLIVVVVFLSISKLGTVGALKCSTAALGCALVAGINLRLAKGRNSERN